MNDDLRSACLIDLDAFSRTHGLRLRRFIGRRLRIEEDVEDVYQDTLVDAHTHRAAFLGTGRPETWIFGIALNKVRSHIRSKVRYQRLLMDEAEGEAIHRDAAGSAESVADIREQVRRVLHILQAEVAEDARGLVYDVLVEGRSYQQAAEVHGVPIGTVRSRVARARDRVRRDRPALDQPFGSEVSGGSADSRSSSRTTSLYDGQIDP
jgi:RNA polymerase sigma factor (sigma-70 family)